MAFPLSKSSIILVAIATIFLLSLSHGVTARSELIDGVCKNSTQCLRLLSCDPRAESAKNLKDLVKVALDLALKHTNATLDQINRMIAGGTYRSSGEKDALKWCGIYHESVFFDFRGAILDIDAGQMEMANFDGGYNARNDATTCENVLSEDKVRIPWILQRTSEAMTFSDIVYDITIKLGG